MNKCPKCGADVIDINFGDFQVTSDCLIIDVIATCTKCNTESNVTYNLINIREDV